MQARKNVPITEEYLSKILDEKLKGFATKEDLKGLPTQDDPKGFATKNDLRGFATKEDLKKFATKGDLKRFATKEDLRGFPTQDDPKGFATKNDLNKLEVKIDKLIGMVFKNDEDDVAHEMIHESNSDDLVNLKNHVRHVERVLEIVPPFPAIA